MYAVRRKNWFFYMQGQLRYGVKTAIRKARKQGNKENKEIKK